MKKRKHKKTYHYIRRHTAQPHSCHRYIFKHEYLKKGKKNLKPFSFTVSNKQSFLRVGNTRRMLISDLFQLHLNI